MTDEVSKGRPLSAPIEPSAETFSGLHTLDIRTDRLLSSWLREAGVPDGALKANELPPISFSPRQMESSFHLWNCDKLHR